MKEQLVSVRESSEEFLQETQKLREELNQQTVLSLYLFVWIIMFYHVL